MNFFGFSADQLVVATYLLVMLVVGLLAGRGIKTMKDYSIADKSYKNTVIIITLLATMFGGGSTIGISQNIHIDGIIVTLATTPGFVIAYMFMAYFIAPNMHKFRDMISVGDIMFSLYGTTGRYVTAVFGVFLCLGLIAAQILSAGHLLHATFDFPLAESIIISASVLILYSSFGGIKSVTVTDVLQLAILIVAIPMMAMMAFQHVGGAANIINSLPTEKLTIFNNPQAKHYLAVFIVWAAFPSLLLGPPAVQRMLMARDGKVIKQMYQLGALLEISFQGMITILALCAFLIFPNIEPAAALPSLINEILPPFLKGLAIAGILAVIMSTADSYLNSSAILLIHDILKPSMSRRQIQELKLTKFATAAIGITSVFMALSSGNILNLAIDAIAIWGPIITIPLAAGIIGFRSCQKAFVLSFIATISTHLLVMYIANVSFGIKDYKLLAAIVAIFVNAFSFFYFSYKYRQHKRNEPYSIVSSLQYLSNKAANKVKEFSFLRYINDVVAKTGSDHKIFAIFCCLNYIAPYFMWTAEKAEHYELILAIRFICGFLCVGLLIESVWPRFLRKYFNLYWYFTLTFCLPFTTTVMVLTQSLSAEWMINLCLSLFLLAVLVHWVSYILLFTVGALAGFTVCLTAVGAEGLYISLDLQHTYLGVYVLIFSSIIGIVFTRQREFRAEKKINFFKDVSGVLSHDARTPLSGIYIISEMYEDIIKSSKKSEIDGNKIVLEVDGKDYNMLEKMPQMIRNSLNKGYKFINTFTNLANNGALDDLKKETSLYKCLDIAKAAFDSSKQHLGTLKIIKDNDIIFVGSEKYMSHVLLNILMNAVNHGGRNVDIHVSVSNDQVTIEDNGVGITEDVLPNIFDKTFSTSGSSGLGLSFCKMMMEDIGGSITCESEPGRYTKLILKFN